MSGGQTDQGLPDHRIRDFGSFKAATKEPYQVAGLYFYEQLDCLVDLAHRVSYDFFKRPHLYLRLDAVGRVESGDADNRSIESGITDLDSTPPQRRLREVLAELHARTGYDELFPSKSQRAEIYRPIFGGNSDHASVEEGDFPRLRDALLDAVAAFAERVFSTGEEMLREGVKSAHRPLADYLRGLLGDSVRWSREDALAGLTENVAYRILRSAGISGVFGIQTPLVPDWPYAEDSNGDKLVEAISRQLVWNDQPTDSAVSRERISNLQRVALRGAEALATIIDFRETDSGDSGSNEELNRLITKCYTWRTALASVAAVQSSPAPAAQAASNTIAMGHTTLYGATTP